MLTHDGTKRVSSTASDNASGSSILVYHSLHMLGIQFLLNCNLEKCVLQLKTVDT